MIIDSRNIEKRGLSFTLRCPEEKDAEELSELRVIIDSETEYLDREEGEGVLSPDDFRQMIKEDCNDSRSLFLVAEADGKLVGFTRCIGFSLKRFRHKAEFGICILKEYWGYGIGGEMLKGVTEWADSASIEKISLYVVEDNIKAIELYKRYGFKEEGLLIKDRIHSDGSYHKTVIMGRIKEEV